MNDAPHMFHYASNPNVSRFTLWEPHASLKDSQTFIEGYAFRNYLNNVPDPYAITLRDQPAVVIGTVGCFWVSPHHATMELGFALAEEHWGKGLTVEASRALIDFVFNHYPIERLQCRCKTENVASARVMAKLGFEREGVLRSAVFHRERYWDILMTAMLRGDWKRALGK